MQEKHEPADFREIVAEHHVSLRAFIRGLGVDPEWVDDLAQETFVIAYRELDRFDAERDLGKWLRGVARNVVRNETRKHARRRRIMHEGLADLLLKHAEAEPTPLERSRLSALRDCVEQLPKRSRQLVSGRYADGWTASDLATQLGMTPAAVRQTLLRIRNRLKQCVEMRVAEEM
jgi:RNA polymerase sigma-70 factor (ECF subfamily)